MATNPETAFIGKVTPASAGYPYGAARDVSAPGDGTGTPLKAIWLNDWFGLQQQLLSLAGITPSGVSDAVGACQVWDALYELLSPSRAPTGREAIRRSYADAGYTLVSGSFEEGGSVANAGEVLLYEANGKAYGWGGTFPKVVAAGSTPATSGGIAPTAWTDKSGELLRTTVNELSKNVSDLLVANAPAPWQARTNTTGAAPRMVVTGDSLSYNHQDFDPTARQSAYECWPGMNSWSFALRDAVIRGKNFIHGDSIPHSSLTMLDVGVNSALLNAAYTRPFNGRTRSFLGTNGPLKFYVKNDSAPNGTLFMWYLKNPTNTACSFKYRVNGGTPTTIDTFSLATDQHRGFDLKAFDLPIPYGTVAEVELFDFVGTHPSPHATNRAFELCGVGPQFAEVHQTGVGGQSSKWLADNVVNAITQYAPDYLVFTIGANDPWAGNPQGLQTVAQYQTNLRTILNATIASNALCKILLISQPHTNEAIYSNATADTYIAAAKEVAREYGIGFINAAELFSGISPVVYRFDSIHYSKQGNAILLDAVSSKIGVDNLFSDVFFSVSDKPVKRPEFNKCTATYQFSATSAPAVFLTADFSGAPRPIGSLSYVNASRIRLVLNYSKEMLGTISITQRASAAAAIKIDPSIVSVGGGFVEIDLVGADGADITQAQWDNGANTSSFSFVVSAS